MKLDKNTRILAVCAHPDDEVLGCGGTLIKAVEKGAQVCIMFLGEGISARFPVGEYSSPEFSKQTNARKDGAIKALNKLNITNVQFGDLLCGQFDTYPLLSIVKNIEKKMEEFKPTMLFTHSPSEVNIDHRTVFWAVESACRPTRPWIPSSIYTFEIICSAAWTLDRSFTPNTFIDIEPYWDKKLEAWDCYSGENRDFPFPRSNEGLKTLAQYRGISSNLKKAEAFHLVRQIIKD